jgi:phosphoenolpyruvate carboxykinase (ATP)
MVDAAIEGRLDRVEYQTEPVFGLQIPLEVPGVPSEILNPRQAWSDPAAYDAQAQRLARLFVENFEKYRAEAAPDVIAAAPNADG